MKSKEEILESGLLEQYVLGLTNAEEKMAVESYLLRYPELKDHVDTIERAMEVIAHQHAIVPPEQLRSATMARIAKEESINFSSFNSKLKWLTGIAAALLLFSFGYGILITKTNSQLGEQISGLETRITTLDRDCALVKDDYLTSKRLLEMYMDENITPVKLSGNNLLPDSELVVFWNPATEKACIKVNSMDDAPADHIYQIWADVEGEMLSLGTFNSIKEIIDINFLKNAESLNVTIEKGQGSEHPDVSRLVMSSKV